MGAGRREKGVAIVVDGMVDGYEEKAFVTRVRVQGGGVLLYACRGYDIA